MSKLSRRGSGEQEPFPVNRDAILCALLSGVKRFPPQTPIISQRRPSSPVTKLSFGITGLVVEDHIEEGAVDMYAAVVLNEAELAEPIEKETHTRARSANHLGERCLANFRNDRVRFPFFAKVGQ